MYRFDGCFNRAESGHHDARAVADKAAPAHRAATRAHARNRMQVARNLARRRAGGRLVPEHQRADRNRVGRYTPETSDRLGIVVARDPDPLAPALQGVPPLSYNELVELARERKVPLEATGGSIATITNYGTFGLTWATPIPLPEQTLVLGMGAGRRAPSWDEAKQQFLPITECNLSLSFDHRVLDGGAAGRLLQRIAAFMQQPEKL